MSEKIIASGYSIFETEYLGYKVVCPIYIWKELETHFPSIAIAISKTLIYHRFSPNCVKDHHLWRSITMGQEALRLADYLTRDRDFRKAVRSFNEQAYRMKYGDNWLKPFDTGQSIDFPNHIAQLGQLIYNSVTFLLKADYLKVYGDLVKVIRPYFCPPAEYVLRRDWAKQTCEFITKYLKENRKYPALRRIAEEWKVPRYVLIEAGLTRETIMDMYRHYRRTGEVKFIEPRKEYKVLSEQEQKDLARRIIERVTPYS